MKNLTTTMEQLNLPQEQRIAITEAFWEDIAMIFPEYEAMYPESYSTENSTNDINDDMNSLIQELY